MERSRTAVLVAAAANVLVAVAKFTAAFFTGSSALLSEGVHSVVDTVNDGLLLFGQNRARRPADELHPFGYGHEVYFWSFVVAISIFGIGGGLTAYEGLIHLLHPTPLDDPQWIYATLGLALLFDGGSLVVAARKFNETRGDRGWFEAIHEAKDPAAFTVLFEDTAAVVGVTIAAVGTTLALVTGDPVWDGIASVAIGVLLATVAFLLAGETKGLLLGESARKETVRAIRRGLAEDSDVARVDRVLTMQMGPNAVLVDLQLLMRRDLTRLQLREALDRLERRIRERHPDVTHVFVELGEQLEEERTRDLSRERAGGGPTGPRPPNP